jgi:O-antigen/teichoic acid export membrane protein
MNYGAWAFISSMAMKLTYWFDSLLITWFLGPTHVAIYAVGSMVVSYGSALVDQCNMVFSPQIMSSCAKNDFFSVKDMFKKATLTIISAGTVIFLGFIVFGGEFISLWMGEDFNQGYTITVLLAISKMFDLPAIAGRPVFWGLNKMRYGAYLDLFQGVSTVVLAITFLVLFKMGIVGVALANLAPQLVVSISMGILACRWIDLPAVWLSKQVLLRWVALMAAFYLICICLMHLLPSSGWGWFVVKVAVAVGVYVPLVWAILLCRQDKIQLQAYIVGTFSSESPNATV